MQAVSPSLRDGNAGRPRVLGILGIVAAVLARAVSLRFEPQRYALARMLAVLTLVVPGCLLFSGSAAAATKTVNQYLGAAGPSGAGAPWAMIALGNFTANGPGVDAGNVAVASGAATLSSPFTLNGKLYLGQGVSYSSNVTPSGGVSSASALVSEAASAATTASEEFNALLPTQTFGTLTEGTTIRASSTNNFNVVDASAVSMSNGTLTLEGNSASVFIINVSGDFTSSNSDIVLSGGLNAANVVWNIAGNLTISGGGEENFYGTALVINGHATVHDKIWNGEIIAREITDTSGFRVKAFPPEPAFTIEKRQEIAGSNAGFTTSPLTGKVGQTVDYQIIVKDTGNTSLTFATLSDAKCSSIEPSGSVTLASGESKTYTCVHVLNSEDQAAGFHENCATATATPPVGSSITHASNCVVVTVPPPPTPHTGVLPTTAVAPALAGPQGCVRGGAVISIKATGVASVTFYLDGHKLKTLTNKNARHGKLSITIQSSKLRIGAHKVVAKITMNRTAGSTIQVVATRKLTFVHCGSAIVAPMFTG